MNDDRNCMESINLLPTNAPTTPEVEELEQAAGWSPSFARVPTIIKKISSGLRIPSSPRDHDRDSISSSQYSLAEQQHSDSISLHRHASIVPPKSRGPKSFRIRMGKRKAMLCIQSVVSWLICIVNFSVTVWALTKFIPVAGTGTFLVGECSRVSQLNTGIHVLLNVLSSLFLGTSNYCMQVLSSPSAKELEQFHSQHRHYDVGVQSTYNIRQMTKRSGRAGLGKGIMWFMLGILSIMTHFIWNSVIFSSIPYTTYPAAVVTSDFQQVADDWAVNNAQNARLSVPQYGPSVNDLHSQASGFMRLDASECIQQYINPLNASASLVLVTNTSSADFNETSLIWSFIGASDPTRWEAASSWVCAAYYNSHQRYCSWSWAESFANEWILQGPHGNQQLNVTVNHCLVGQSGDEETRCGLQYSAYLLVSVCMLTAMISLLVAWTAYRYHEQTCVVIGDVIASCLQHPQQTPVLTAASQNQHSRRSAGTIALADAQWPMQPKGSFWFYASGRTAWRAALVLFFAAIALGFALFGIAIKAFRMKSSPVGLLYLWNAGLGTANPYSLVGGILAANNLGVFDLVGRVLFANVFQLLISFLYLFYNNILTCQVVADEFIRFLESKKALRVSAPETSTQRSSYTLSLPLKYAIPHMLSFMLLHWLVSQSIFMVQTIAYSPGPNGQRIPAGDGSRVGFSAIGILLSSFLGVVMVIALSVNGLRKFPRSPRYMSRMASNSLAINAFCQRPEVISDAHQSPMRLGIIKEGIDLPAGCEGRLVFSDGDLEEPRPGTVYQQPVWV